MIMIRFHCESINDDAPFLLFSGSYDLYYPTIQQGP